MVFWAIPLAAFLMLWATGIYVQALDPKAAGRVRLVVYLAALLLASCALLLVTETAR